VLFSGGRIWHFWKAKNTPSQKMTENDRFLHCFYIKRFLQPKFIWWCQKLKLEWQKVIKKCQKLKFHFFATLNLQKKVHEARRKGNWPKTDQKMPKKGQTGLKNDPKRVIFGVKNSTWIFFVIFRFKWKVVQKLSKKYEKMEKNDKKSGFLKKKGSKMGQKWSFLGVFEPHRETLQGPNVKMAKIDLNVKKRVKIDPFLDPSFVST